MATARLQHGRGSGDAAQVGRTHKRPGSIRLQLRSALQCAEFRRACLAVEGVVCTIDSLDTLSLEAALDCVRDYRESYENGCKGKFSEFKRRTLILRVASHGGNECPSPPNQLQAPRDLLSQFK